MSTMLKRLPGRFKYKCKLEMLAKLGYTDTKSIKKKLNEYDGDANRIIQEQSRVESPPDIELHDANTLVSVYNYPAQRPKAYDHFDDDADLQAQAQRAEHGDAAMGALAGISHALNPIPYDHNPPQTTQSEAHRVKKQRQRDMVSAKNRAWKQKKQRQMQRLGLLDLLYFGAPLPVTVARTYLHRIVAEAECLDMPALSPADLCLSATLQLSIAHGHCSRSSAEDKEAACVLSIGRIVYVLLTATFAAQSASDLDALDDPARHMLQRMMCPLSERMSLAQVKQSAFYRGDTLQQTEVQMAMRRHFHQHEGRRRRAMRSRSRSLLQSISDDGDRAFAIAHTAPFCEDGAEGVVDAYCGHLGRKHVLYGLCRAIEQRDGARVRFDEAQQTMVCSVDALGGTGTVSFGVSVFESMWWKRAQAQHGGACKYAPLWVARIRRLHGDAFEFMRVKNELLLTDVLSGCTEKQWAAFGATLEKQKV